MKLSLPLYLKILGWFFLNVLVLAVIGWLLLVFQFHLGPEVLLGGRAGERLRALTQTLTEELYASPRDEWGEIIERFGDAYDLDFRVYGNDRELVAGPAVELPQAVREKLNVRRGGPPGRDGPPPGRDGSQGRREGQQPPQREGGQSRDDLSPRPRNPNQERRPRGNASPPPIPPMFMVKTTEPLAGYWIGVRMSSQWREGRAPEPFTLLIYSPTLSAGGLLVDFSVWIWVGLGAFLFSMLFWAPLIYNITRSIRQMTSATSQIAQGNFTVRVNQRRRDELGTLASAINQMAERLAGFVNGQKRFTGDIAHELCSPLARMQMALSIMEQQPATPAQQDYLRDVREDVEHMSALVHELLAFSKAALGGKNLRMHPTGIRDVIAKAIKRETREGIIIQCEVPEESSAMADPDLLFRAVANVLRNSIKYAGDEGPITISTREQNSQVEVIITDSGKGVPESDIPKLFDPFYRVDLARARETGGTGLGLAIVKTCIESCGGFVSCRNLQPCGFQVSMLLPASQSPALAAHQR